MGHVIGTEDDGGLLLPKQKDAQSPKKRSRFRDCRFPVEPVTFMNAMSYWPVSVVSAQYLYSKIGQDLGYDVRNLTLHSNNSCDTDFNDSTTVIRETIQKHTVTMQLYLSLLQTVPSVVVVLYLGVYADIYGRKKLIILPACGSLIQVFIYGVTSYFNLSVYLLFIANFIYGCFGANSFILMGGRLFISDTVPANSLPFRMILLSVFYYLGDTVASLGYNYMLSVTSFVYVYVCVAIFDVISIIYICVCLKETLPEEKIGLKSSVKLSVYIQGFAQVYCRHSQRPRRLWKVYVLLLSVFLRYCVNFDSTYLLLNAPFCWNSVLIGYFDAALVLVS